MSHNVSDFVIRVKNAIRAKHAYVKIRNTKLNRSLSHLLRSEGFIKGLTYTNSKGWANTNVVAKTVGQNVGENAFTAPKRKTYRTSATENLSERQPEEGGTRETGGTTSTTNSEAMIREEKTSGSGAMERLLGAETPEEQRSKESDFIIVYLKHTGKRNAITDMKVISKPSARMYSSAKALPKVLGGLGTVIVTTSKGVMTDKKARSLKIGGELLFSIW